MASVTDIYNRALQKLGAKRVASPAEASVNARACNACYEILRDAELELHPWKFAITRAELAASATAPDFGRDFAYPLPADFLKLLADYPEDLSDEKDWVIEGREILSDQESPLEVRYISRVTDTSLFPPLFVEALAAKMAEEMAEELTQSNSKKEAASSAYELAIRRAKRSNAFQTRPAVPPESSWTTCRA